MQKLRRARIMLAAPDAELEGFEKKTAYFPEEFQFHLFDEGSEIYQAAVTTALREYVPIEPTSSHALYDYGAGSSITDARRLPEGNGAILSTYR
ncbi:uncharacterized protein ANIA_11311 [Aspergillus nidulans FGSC A4]|uniref:Uncharacterized protein n=1 Tax=Emericella nidulans (strain FGSC A4 / ATCC 38163 / CBS 112.46 / NRRL 194 / M139) TaxID=227321 RepID=C8VNJ8_EMENI|nr:hypothetical protein [Aspergillus nidulans FGSC A4]CBF85297.1 TPA: hypothetical protein ANIA_11311 [Aspergillus nidulans FGSC A4]